MTGVVSEQLSRSESVSLRLVTHDAMRVLSLFSVLYDAARDGLKRKDECRQTRAAASLLAKASISAKSASVTVASLVSALVGLSRSLEVEVRPTLARCSVFNQSVEACQPLAGVRSKNERQRQCNRWARTMYVMSPTSSTVGP